LRDSPPPTPRRGHHRRERQGEILRLVRERELSTQAELAQALREAGVEVVQTTISRDIGELGLVKVRTPGGKLVYAVPGTTLDRDREAELRGALRRWSHSFEASGNILVVQTPSGYSNALAQVIDEAHHPHIAGTIAGENTILVVAREGTTAAELRDELRGYLLEGAA
jgi:transcriptional regulator of arginine metabolism